MDKGIATTCASLMKDLADTERESRQVYFCKIEKDDKELKKLLYDTARKYYANKIASIKKELKEL